MQTQAHGSCPVCARSYKGTRRLPRKIEMTNTIPQEQTNVSTPQPDIGGVGGSTSAVLRGIKNEQAKGAPVCEPWNYQADIPPDQSGTKESFRDWLNDSSTEHLLFFGAEGLNPEIRPNKKVNSIRRLHALIADYDCKITEPMTEGVLTNASSDLQPTWISTTYSGGRRLVWMFEEPILFDDLLAKRFLEIAGRELRVSALLPGLDTNWYNPYQVYEVGSEWRKLT